MSRRTRGFTLIEVMVALAILALGMVSILSTMTNYTANASGMRNRALALWIAHNRLTEIELEPAFVKTGNSDGDVSMGGADWRWFVGVTETSDPSVHRIEIRVQLQNKDADIAHLVAFQSSNGRQAAP